MFRKIHCVSCAAVDPNCPECGLVGSDGQYEVGTGIVLTDASDVKYFIKAPFRVLVNTAVKSITIVAQTGALYQVKLNDTTFNTLEDLAAAACACNGQQSGGGVATSGHYEYDVPITGGNTGGYLRVIATELGATASFASNKLTISQPPSGRLIDAVWKVVAADVQAAADGGGVTNWVQIQFNNTGGNTSLSDMRFPHVDKVGIPTSGTLSVSNAATYDIDNNPSFAPVAVGGGNITIRVGGLVIGGQGYALKFGNI